MFDQLTSLDSEREAAAEASAGADAGKKQAQKGAPGSAAKKKPPPVPAGKSVDKQATVRIMLERYKTWSLV